MFLSSSVGNFSSSQYKVQPQFKGPGAARAKLQRLIITSQDGVEGPIRSVEVDETSSSSLLVPRQRPRASSMVETRKKPESVVPGSPSILLSPADCEERPTTSSSYRGLSLNRSASTASPGLSHKQIERKSRTSVGSFSDANRASQPDTPHFENPEHSFYRTP